MNSGIFSTERYFTLAGIYSVCCWSWLEAPTSSRLTQHNPIRWDDLVWCLWNQCAVEGGGAVTTSVLLASLPPLSENKIRKPEPESAEQAFISPDKGHFTGRRTPQTRQGCKPAVRCCCAIAADLNIWRALFQNAINAKIKNEFVMPFCCVLNLFTAPSILHAKSLYFLV